MGWADLPAAVSPGGADRQIQFNNLGAFGATEGLSLHATSDSYLIAKGASNVGFEVQDGDGNLLSWVTDTVGSLSSASFGTNVVAGTYVSAPQFTTDALGDAGQLFYAGYGFDFVANFEATLTNERDYYAGIISYTRVNPMSVPSGWEWAFGADIEVESAAGATVAYSILSGVYGQAAHRGSFALNATYGLYYSAFTANDATTGWLTGVYALANLYDASHADTAMGLATSTPYAGGTSTITTAYGVSVGVQPKAAGASITTLYGIYVYDQSTSGATTHYNFYSAGANSKNYFAGTVDIGNITTITRAVAAAYADGLVLATDQTATLNNQKWSGGLRFVGSRFQTAAAAARVVDYRIYLKPVQNNGDWGNDDLCFDYSVNGGAYSEFMRLSGTSGRLQLGNSNYGPNGISTSDWAWTYTAGAMTLSLTNDGANITGLRNNKYFESYQAVATTSTDGMVLSTSATATSGNQKWSPRVRLRGSYFSGSAKTTDFIIENQPTASGGLLSISHSDDGAAYVQRVTISPSGSVISLRAAYNTIMFGGGSNEGLGSTGSMVYIAAPGGFDGGKGFASTSSNDLIIGLTAADTFLNRNAAADIRQGGPASATPTAQTSSVQNASGTNIAGAVRYYVGSLATGNAASGGHAFQVGDPGASGTTLQTAATKLLVNTTGIVIPRTSGYGIKLDVDDPQWGWNDIIGHIQPKTAGAGTPTYATYRGNINGFYFAANDIVDFVFHVPHDYVPGTHMYIHVHWSHNGTAISGSATFTHYTMYAKGHNQANFPAEITSAITYATTNITTTPQYRHRVDEIQLSTTGGSASTLNTSDLEVDGVILMRLKLTALPTITAGNLFIHTADIHYQSTGLPTKQKAPNFYAA
jgi:hypothetical protein